jgi:hypothetical protein
VDAFRPRKQSARVGTSCGRTDQFGYGLLVGWVDALEAVDFVEGSICGKDCVDPTVESKGGENRISTVEAGVALEKVDPSLHVVGLERMPPGKPGDAACGLGCAGPVSSAAKALVCELLQEIHAGLALQLA